MNEGKKSQKNANKKGGKGQAKDKVDICETCSEKVEDGQKGILCDLCEKWFHAKCEDIEDREYEILTKQDKGNIHWYCTHCNEKSVDIFKLINALQERVKKTETELENLRWDTGKMKREASAIHTRIEEGLKKLDEDLKKTEEDWLEKDENMEKKLINKVKEVVDEQADLQNQKVKELKKEIKQTDGKIDGLVKIKMEEQEKEQQDKSARRANVVVFGVEESEEVETEGRIAFDKGAMKEILQSARCGDLEIKQIIRLGKREEKKEGEERKPRPLKVVFEEEKSKNEVLEKARTLRKTKHANVFIVQDLTPKERKQRKELVTERDQRKSRGEDVIIYQDKVVVRRKPTPSQQERI